MEYDDRHVPETAIHPVSRDIDDRDLDERDLDETEPDWDEEPDDDPIITCPDCGTRHGAWKGEPLPTLGSAIFPQPGQTIVARRLLPCGHKVQQRHRYTPEGGWYSGSWEKGQWPDTEEGNPQ